MQSKEEEDDFGYWQKLKDCIKLHIRSCYYVSIETCKDSINSTLKIKTLNLSPFISKCYLKIRGLEIVLFNFKKKERMIICQNHQERNKSLQ